MFLLLVCLHFTTNGGTKGTRRGVRARHVLPFWLCNLYIFCIVFVGYQNTNYVAHHGGAQHIRHGLALSRDASPPSSCAVPRIVYSVLLHCTHPKSRNRV